MNIENLKTQRKLKNLSQKEVAGHLGLTQQRYNHYETGRREPDNQTLINLADFFGVSVDYLLGNDTTKDNIDNLTNDDVVANDIYNVLVDIGFIDDGEEITDKHLEVLTKILAPQIDYAKFELSLKKLEDENQKNDK